MNAISYVLATAVLLSFSSASFAASHASLRLLVQPGVEGEYESLAEFYKDLHSHPELSFQEQRTSAKLAAQLRAAGFEVTEKVGGYGVVGVFRNGKGPTALVRSDMDALPVKEQTGLPYASKARAIDDGKEVDVMHACGHDIHMTCLVGTARELVALKDRWHGTLVFIGQPAEERISGAKAMLAEGLFTRFPKPDFCLALHVSAEIPAGKLGYTEGYALASSDGVDILVRGVGGHGAYPHKTKDPIVLASELVLALQTIVSRETNPLEPSVLTIGSFHAGTKHNIIPDEARLQLTLRSYSEKVRDQQIESIKRIANGLASAAGVPKELMPVVMPGKASVKSTYNDPALTRRVVNAFEDWFGKELLVRTPPTMGAEDFGMYGNSEDKIPSCIFWLGSVDPDRSAESHRTGLPLPSLHSSKFSPMLSDTLKTGVIAMTAAVIELTAK